MTEPDKESPQPPDDEIVLHYGTAPCGHSERFLWTEDGGKHIVCLLCERMPVAAEESPSAPQPRQDEVAMSLPAFGTILEQLSKSKARVQALEEALRHLDVEQLTVDLCRELYDRFTMGGWTPEDAHAETVLRLQQWKELLLTPKPANEAEKGTR